MKSEYKLYSLIVILLTLFLMTVVICTHIDISSSIKKDKEVQMYEIQMKYLGESVKEE